MRRQFLRTIGAAGLGGFLANRAAAGRDKTVVTRQAVVPGQSVLLQHGLYDQPSPPFKNWVRNNVKNNDGDVVDLGGQGKAAILRLGYCARVVVFDSGQKNNPKSGQFWCHYPIPVAVRGGTDITVQSLIVGWETSAASLGVAELHFWAGGQRRHTRGFELRPGGVSQVLGIAVSQAKLPLSISLRVVANNARDAYLDLIQFGVVLQEGA